MESGRWEQVQNLFHDALQRPENEQLSFLESACAGDPGLLDDVLALLREDSRKTSLLERDMARVADGVLEKPALPPGDFGPYRLQRILGEGGMGVVYLAERTDVGNRVAIKLLRDAWLSPSRRERFTSEQRTLAQLNHPSIARLYDADTLPDGTPWFAMEYVEGAPLTGYCREHACAIEERLRLFREVCEAVQHAHRHAVIHRDLKPSNILVKADGSVRLLDFGIAKQMDTLDGTVDHTRTGLRLMTPAYAAPEQVRGERTGIHTDVYALGVILYELLAGRLPFDLGTRTPAEMETAIVEKNPERPSAVALRETCPAGAALHKAAWDDLDVLCLTAMHKDPQRRYGSVEALLRDVDHYLKGEPLEARPDRFGYRLGKFVRRNRRPVLAASAVFVVVVGLVVFFTVRLAIARNTAEAETARTERIQQFMMKLFEGGDEAVGPGESLKVITLLDRGVQEAQTLSNEPAVQAELYETLGDIYQKIGKFDRADALQELALQRRKSIFGAQHAEVADSLVALGLLRLAEAKLPESEKLVRDGLAMARRTLPPDHPAIAKATQALGKVLEERGVYGQAIPVLEQAVKLWSARGPASPELANAILELGNTEFYAGHLDVSETVNKRALAMHRQLFGERYPLVADDLVNLGAIQFQRGRYAESERFDREALAITRAWYGDDHPRTAANLNMLGQSLEYENKLDEAEATLRQALAIRERVYGPVHPLVASTLNELGGVALQRSHWDQAEAYFRRDVEIYKSVYHDRHYLIGIATANVGSVYMDRKDWVHAEPFFREAVRRLIDTLGADQIHTAIARIKLGRVLLRQNRYADAEVETRAGYDFLIKQSSPAVTWIRSARMDLAAIYDGLHKPDLASRYRAELASAAAQKPGKK